MKWQNALIYTLQKFVAKAH